PPSPSYPYLSSLPLSFFPADAAHRDLHSFPTRRSSDLIHRRACAWPATFVLRIAMSRPLDGITVVTLEHAIAAPFCTRQLADLRSEEHTSELQSRENLVCRLLLEKKKTIT